MQGRKFSNALDGIKSILRDNLHDSSISFTIAKLGSRFEGMVCEGIPRYVLDFLDRDDLGHLSPTASATALWDSVIGLDHIIKAGEEDAVVINIFTDGQDNNSRKGPHHAMDIVNGWKRKKHTVTFMGTHSDVNFIGSKLDIDKSNLLGYENSSAGVETAFRTFNVSTVSYIADVKAGASLDSLSTGFFKRKGTL
jgi:hypothetical protein